MNGCNHTYNTTFKSTDENLTLIDQNFYVYVERAKEGINIGGQTSFEQGKYYVFPIGTTVDGKEVAPAKLYTIGKAVSEITLDKTTLTINRTTADVTGTLTATVTPTDATNTSVSWTSSDESVATVSNGVVTGKKGGTATITATSDGQSATCTVTVVQKVTSISISGGFSSSSSNPYVWGSETTDNKTLTATVLPADATNKTVKWSSNATNVTVDENTGKITITAPNTNTTTQTVTITATAQDGSGVSATYTLYLANYVQIAGTKWYTYDSQTSVTWANRTQGAPSGSAVPSRSQFETLIKVSNTTVSGNNIISNNGSNAYITLTYGDYWMSTEYLNDYAVCLGFDSGGRGVFSLDKSNYCRVRLVRVQ